MNLNFEELQELLNKTEVIYLATSENDNVTSRPVSPLCIGETIYIRTSQSSLKAQQMKKNPNTSICIENFYFTAKATCLGSVVLTENETIKNAYKERFPESFSEADEFIQSDEVFFELKPAKLFQWIYKDDIPVGLAEKALTV